METGDGALFVKNLAYFVRTHEKALADAQNLRRQPRRHTISSNTSTGPGVSRPTTSASNLSTNVDTRTSASAGLASSSWIPSFGRASPKPAVLFLTPNQLYYLLSRFNDLGVNTGPNNIRVESIHAAPSTSSNYVSFLAQSQPPKIRSPDADSIHSVTSVRSFMTSMSNVLSHLSLTSNSSTRAARQEAATKEDVRYLYSAFTKVPCLKLSRDYRMKPIAGFEEYPFDTAVPTTVFKNLMEFEVADIDFRSVYGWDTLADNLQCLIVKRASVDDLSELLHDIVLDDMDQRRHRSSKQSNSPFPLTAPSSPGASKLLGWPGSTSPFKSPSNRQRPSSSDDNDPQVPARQRNKKPSRSISPQHALTRRRTSLYARPQVDGRRSSGSSASGSRVQTPRQSSTCLLLQTTLPPTKWRFLRHLSVVDCGLTSVNRESLLPLTNSLRSLDLSSNLFTDVPEALSSLSALQQLKLSDCLIDSLRGLRYAPLLAVSVLNVKGNKLSSLAGIENLLSLQRLDVRDNRLTDPVEAARLTGMPGFLEIFVKRNPFTRTHTNYRVKIWNVFRATPGYVQDIIIDSTGADRSERRQLIDRVPHTPQAAAIDPAANLTSLHSGEPTSADSKMESRDPGATDRSTSTTEEREVKQQRRKAPKRRVVDVTDEPQSPAVGAESAVAQPASVSAEWRKEDAKGNVLQDEAEQEGQVQEPQSATATQLPDADKYSRIALRPSIRRGLSQSSEVYRQKLETLKNENSEAWLKALESPSLRPDPTLSPFLKHQTSSGVFSPIKTASIASVKI